MSHTIERITIVTSPPPSNSTLPQSPIAGQGPTPFLIHERHRTIYVTSDNPQLAPEDIGRVLSLADIPEANQEEQFRRSRSLGDVLNVIGTASPKSRSDRDLLARPATYYPKQSPAQRPSISLPNSPAAQRTPSSKSHSHPIPLTQIAPRQRILFYHKHDPYYGFTNFSAHPVTYKGKKYPTSEHLFQSFKFHGHRPNLAEHIRTCSERPSVAFSEARRFQPEARSDWKHVNIEKMDIALYHKFTQHADLQAELLGTGDAELVEDSDKDAFWGVGPDGRGRNELGKALERLRAKLREAAQHH